ncbi:MAG: SCP2 sterol-binding domain-containing protein, partial [Thermoleophilaceae bacterium]|nr:SCP2 sterol-binding domain-containing protein [Thermoleophilaceae bacterium]
STRAEPGRADRPTVTFRARFEDFVDVVAGREDPRRLAVRGRLRPSGDVRWLWRSRGMFPG